MLSTRALNNIWCSAAPHHQICCPLSLEGTRRCPHHWRASGADLTTGGHQALPCHVICSLPGKHTAPQTAHSSFMYCPAKPPRTCKLQLPSP